MVWSMGRQTAAKPGRAQRLKSDASQESESSTSSRTIEDRLKTQKEDNSKQVKQIQKILSMEENRQLDEECLQRFIKVNVRLLTDDQVREQQIFLTSLRVHSHDRLFEAHDSPDAITSHEQQTKKSRRACVRIPWQTLSLPLRDEIFHRLSNKIIASIISITDSRARARQKQRGEGRKNMLVPRIKQGSER